MSHPPMRVRTAPPVMFITYAYDDPDEAPILDSSPTLEEARKWTEGRGFVYSVERQERGKDGLYSYGNEQFIEGPRSIHGGS